jgi:hypothetical protein
MGSVERYAPELWGVGFAAFFATAGILWVFAWALVWGYVLYGRARDGSPLPSNP